VRAVSRLGLIVALASVPVSAQQSPTVRGVVLDEQTGSPIAAAAMQLTDASGLRVAAALSDANGVFQMTAPAAGKYRVRAERAGYFAKTSADVTLPGAASVELRLSPHPILLDSLLAIGKTAEFRRVRANEQLIHGRLIDDDSRAPIPLGTVELQDNKGNRILSITADAHGLFRIVTPKPAAYLLQAAHAGYRTAKSPVLRMMLGDTIRLDFHLSTKAVLLAPILVTATARRIEDRREMKGLDDLYNRMSKYAKSGFGEFITRDSMVSYDNRGMTTSTMISMRAFRTPTQCTMPVSTSQPASDPRTDYYLNGAPFIPSDTTTAPDGLARSISDELAPHVLEAIEVYLAPTIPAEFVTPMFQGEQRRIYGMPCRVVVFWTRR
jgi:hypothetical protein